MENDIIKQFNLPNYAKNKSFADASSQIKRRFAGREDAESKNTEKDLLDRLRQAQEFVKAQEQAKQQAIQQKKAMAQGDAVVDDTGQVINRNDPAVQNGAVQPNQPPQPPDVSQDPQAQAAMQQMDQQTPQQPQQGLMGNIQQALGGRINRFVTGGKLNPDGTVQVNPDGTPVDPANVATDATSTGTTAPSAAGIAGAGVGAAGTLAHLGMTAFGPTGVDTSGATSVDKKSVGMEAGKSALEGAASGAQLGNMIMPGVGGAIGAGAGAVIGGAAGALGAVGFNKDAQQAQVNNTFMKASKANNTFAVGGPIPKNKYAGINFVKDGNPIGMTPGLNDRLKEKTTYTQTGADPIMQNILGQSPQPAIKPNAGAPTLQTDVTNRLAAEKQPGGILLNPYIKDTQQPYNAGVEDMVNEYSGQQAAAKKADLDYWAGQADKATSTSADATSATDPNKKGIDWKGLGKTAAGSGEALRYAPALMDAYQLATLKHPKQEGTARIDARYKPQYTDENAVLNTAREETNAAREAIKQTSGGSASEARANLLATQLNSMKGLSAASQAGREANLAENRQAQSFNLGIDQANIAQSNLQQDINDRNKGAYDTQKSKLLASLGTTAGAIGKEELYKKYPEMMGLSYNWRGKYEDLSDEEKAKITESRASDKKKLKYSKTGSTKETE